MEVLFGLADSLGYSEKELLKVRDKKRDERGGFKEGIVLKSVSGLPFQVVLISLELRHNPINNDYRSIELKSISRLS